MRDLDEGFRLGIKIGIQIRDLDQGFRSGIQIRDLLQIRDLDQDDQIWIRKDLYRLDQDRQIDRYIQIICIYIYISLVCVYLCVYLYVCIYICIASPHCMKKKTCSWFRCNYMDNRVHQHVLTGKYQFFPALCSPTRSFCSRSISCLARTRQEIMGWD